MLKIILISIVAINALFAFNFVRDLVANKEEAKNEPAPTIPLAISSFFMFFLSTFGISYFAISTVLYRKLNWVDDKRLPGTLNTQCVLPVAVMALAYISSIEIEVMTLALCILAQIIGAYIGPRFVVKLPADTIRKFVGTGLIIATIIIVANNLGVVPSGGVATSLRGWKLAVAIVALFVYGALNNIGIGSYALTMVTVHALGLNPAVAFPVMMGAATFSVPVGSMQFIKFKEYSRKITLFTSTVGVAGVLFAVTIVKNLDVSMLQWVVAIVLAYSGIDMLISQFKKETA